MRSVSYQLAVWVLTGLALLPFVLGAAGVGPGAGWWAQRVGPVPGSIVIGVTAIVVLEVLIFVVSLRLSRASERDSES